MLVKSYYKVYKAFPDPDYFYIQNEYAGTNTFVLQKNGTPATTDLAYSKDKSTWTSFDLTQSQNTVSLLEGEKLYLRSSTGFSNGSNNKIIMRCYYNYSVGGHIATLLDYENVDSITEIPAYAFYSMFEYSNNKMISAEDLDFSGITSVDDYGMSSMFRYCNQLTAIPDISSITTCGDNSLKSTFGYDTSLTSADFSNFTSVGNSGFYNILENCSSVNVVVAPNISSWSTNAFSYWLSGVSATGVLRKPAALEIPTDSTSGVPTGWTTENY